jgi:quercetin dioxygenase-like cupin family protein
MSTISEIISALETASHPVARALHKGDQFKVLMIGFKKGMILQDHKAHIPSKLTVLQGSVVYREGEEEVHLPQYDEVGIPVEVTHSVEALEDSLCLLTQGGFSN